MADTRAKKNSGHRPRPRIVGTGAKLAAGNRSVGVGRIVTLFLADIHHDFQIQPLGKSDLAIGRPAIGGRAGNRDLLRCGKEYGIGQNLKLLKALVAEIAFDSRDPLVIDRVDAHANAAKSNHADQFSFTGSGSLRPKLFLMIAQATQWSFEQSP